MACHQVQQEDLALFTNRRGEKKARVEVTLLKKTGNLKSSKIARTIQYSSRHTKKENTKSAESASAATWGDR